MSSQNDLGPAADSKQSAVDKALALVGSQSASGSQVQLYRDSKGSVEESDDDVTQKEMGVGRMVKEEIISIDDVEGMVKDGGI